MVYGIPRSTLKRVSQLLKVHNSLMSVKNYLGATESITLYAEVVITWDIVFQAAYNIGGNTVSVDMIQSSILGCRLPRPGQVNPCLLLYLDTVR